jgi:signal transduction histidine kinase
MKIGFEMWRSTISRLLLIYGAFFVVWSIVLLGAIQWETTRYIARAVDQLIVIRMHYLQTNDPARLPEGVAATGSSDPIDTMSVGVFDATGRYQLGNIQKLPAGIQADGKIRTVDVNREHRDHSTRIRAMAVRLKTGQLVVLGKDTSVIDGIGTIIRKVLLWALSLTVIPGLIGGFLLARGPARRIRVIKQATESVVRGNLAHRLPVSRRGDELDLLSGIVNTMLDEIERLMGEVKGVCDNLAHDLRTPLTRLRARLYRTQQQLNGAPAEAKLIECCLEDTDALLARFRALLRISELEDRQRRACFKEIDLAPVLQQVHEFYAPLAEDRRQRFELDLHPLAPVQADPHLMFEAFANLIGNAIKFTPDGGFVRILASMDEGTPRVDIVDSGPGIPIEERGAVTRRFYRGQGSRTTPGSGLGLSLVNAIAHLHGYTLEIGSTRDGAMISLVCREA